MEDQKPIQKTYFHKFHKILPVSNLLNVRFEKGSWRSPRPKKKKTANYKKKEPELGEIGVP